MEIYRNKDINDLDGEIWKDIDDYPGYQVSNLGRIKSLKHRKIKILSQNKNCRGYLRVCLCKNNISKTKEIHRIVYKAFCEKFKLIECIHHINVNKLDNNFTNLTNWEKLKHLSYHSLGKNNSFFGKNHSKENKKKMSIIRKEKYRKGELKILNQKGENNNNSKLSNKKIIQIKMLFKLGFRNSEIYKLYNIGTSTVSNIRNNRTWKYI